jgi:hypothetical protein
MPRYFFNVHDGQDLPDSEGFELPDRDAAHREAFHTAGEMLKSANRSFLQGEEWERHVTDEAGKNSMPSRVLGRGLRLAGQRRSCGQ